MNHIYIGIDSATVLGLAVYHPSQEKAQVSEFKGTPLEQLNQMSGLIKTIYSIFEHSEVTWVFEQQHNFRNAIVTRSLLERQGFLKWSLIGCGFNVTEVSPDVARSYLKTKDKEGTFLFFTEKFKGTALTSNHTDALAVALCRANIDGHTPDLKKLRVEEIR